jgi:hypothetical protein
MRGEGMEIRVCSLNYDNRINQKSFNARCLESLVNASDGVDYSSGTFVWTLFDYYGEPPSAGLEVSSTYGQFDLCGFPKAAAMWFRTQWLLNSVDDTGPEPPDKPFATAGLHEVYIVESWESPDHWNETKGNKTKTIHVYSNAPIVELFHNGQSQGSLPVSRMDTSAGTYAAFEVPWKAGELTAFAWAKNGTTFATTTKHTNKEPHALVLNLDCPSVATGTGEALLLDGQDVALVRATIVDSLGQPVHMSIHNVTFEVVSGPGTIVGTANGDSKSYQPHTSPWQTAYHGLVRAVVQVTSMAALEPEMITMLQTIDGPSIQSSMYPSWRDDAFIVVEASTPGLPKAVLRIPTSTMAQDSVMAVATATAGQPINFFQEPPVTGDASDDTKVT